MEDRQWAEARKELELVRGEIAPNQALAFRPEVSQLLGKVMFSLGDYAESIHMEEEAIEDLMAQKGRDHQHTVNAQMTLAAMFLELGRIDDAQRVASSVERTLVAGTPSQQAVQPVVLSGNQLEVARGSEEAAELNGGEEARAEPPQLLR